jgi:hypothetical protein
MEIFKSKGVLSEGCTKALKEIFSRYCDDKGKMYEFQIETFTTYCQGAKNISREILRTWDLDRDDALNESEFLNFYSQNNRIDNIWKNLHSHGYGPDFRQFSDPMPTIIKEDILPRFMIATNKEYFDILFNLLGK